jgi:hypothetical protein
MFEADELLVIVGKAVCEFFPPSLLSRILSECEKEFATGTADLVIVEQAFDFSWLQAGSGSLVSADLGGRPLQRCGDGISALALALSDPAQFSGKSAPPYRGTRWRDHRVSLLLGAAGGLVRRSYGFS